MNPYCFRCLLFHSLCDSLRTPWWRLVNILALSSWKTPGDAFFSQQVRIVFVFWEPTGKIFSPLWITDVNSKKQGNVLSYHITTVCTGNRNLKNWTLSLGLIVLVLAVFLTGKPELACAKDAVRDQSCLCHLAPFWVERWLFPLWLTTRPKTNLSKSVLQSS